MIEKQPEALRLADALDTDRAWLAKRQLHQQSMSDASAVLRTQHEAIKELREALRELRRAINFKAACITSNCTDEKIALADRGVWTAAEYAQRVITKHGA